MPGRGPLVGAPEVRAEASPHSYSGIPLTPDRAKGMLVMGIGTTRGPRGEIIQRSLSVHVLGQLLGPRCLVAAQEDATDDPASKTAMIIGAAQEVSREQGAVIGCPVQGCSLRLLSPAKNSTEFVRSGACKNVKLDTTTTPK